MPSRLYGKTVTLGPSLGHGLGFDMDDDRRQSNSDESTLEVSTPTTATGPKGAYPDDGENVVVIPETIKEPSGGHEPISAAFQNTSTDTSPASRRSANDHDQDDDEGESLRYAWETS